MERQSVNALYECKTCKRQFGTAQSLEEHNQAKHTKRGYGVRKSHLGRNMFLVLTILVISFASYNLYSLTTPSPGVAIEDASKRFNPSTPTPPPSSQASNSMPTVYYFGFQCAECAKTNEALARLIPQFSGKLNFRVVDITRDPQATALAAQFNVRYVPYLVFTDKDGRILGTWGGEASYEQILSLIKQNYGL